MNTLLHSDLQWCLLRCPKFILEELKRRPGKAYVAGGFIRAAIAREEINDVDIFCPTKEDAKSLAWAMTKDDTGYRLKESRVHETDNAFTVLGRGKLMPQVIHHWTFNDPRDCVDSFDFTVACAAFWWSANRDVLESGKALEPGWRSVCDERFYPDLAAKRLIYRSPVRNEDAGGSLLRVLKFYQRGYRIPVDSLGAVVARLCQGVAATSANGLVDTFSNEHQLAKILTGLLREVDPAIDPQHVAHLPAENVKDLP